MGFAMLRRALENIRQPTGLAYLDRQKHPCSHRGDEDAAAQSDKAGGYKFSS